MKKINQQLSFIIALVPLFLSGSCADYLDIVPDNVATIEYAFSDRANAERYLYGCYSYRPAIGDINADPAMGGADEIWERLSTDTYFPNTTTSRLARNELNADNPIFNFWDNVLFTGIRDCNIFLENIGSVKVDMTERIRERLIAEAKFLKAYYHFYLLRAYGPIPIVDNNLPISADVSEVKVYRDPVDDVVEYIVRTLEEAIPGLPDVSDLPIGTEGGRADKTIAYTMIADVRLWAASPLVNGNRDYAEIVDNRGVHLFPQGSPDNNKWVVAAEACKTAIDICHEQGKTLWRVIDPLVLTANPVFQLQTIYRNAICERWNTELIWGGTKYNHSGLMNMVTPQIERFSNPSRSGGALSSPTLKIVERYYSFHGVPINEDTEWINHNWYADRYQVREKASTGDEKYLVREGERTVYLHFNREPRFYASIGFDRGIYFGSGYYDFPGNVKWTNFRSGGASGYRPGQFYPITGYAAKKMHHFKNVVTNDAISYEYYPFPIYRLADLYLMYAEAVNEAEGPDGPNSEKMFEYLDDIRDRAGLEGIRDSWTKYAINPNKPNTKDGLREIIQRERTIELAFEGKRFWDIRRWKKINELNEQPQGWNIKAETEEDFYKVTGVSPRTISFSLKDYFFPIREENLYVNKNLIQNYGW